MWKKLQFCDINEVYEHNHTVGPAFSYYKCIHWDRAAAHSLKQYTNNCIMTNTMVPTMQPLSMLPIPLYLLTFMHIIGVSCIVMHGIGSWDRVYLDLNYTLLPFDSIAIPENIFQLTIHCTIINVILPLISSCKRASERVGEETHWIIRKEIV